MIRRCFVLIGLVVIFSFTGGCGGPSPFCPGPSRLKMDYGNSYKLAIFNQTLNPEAEKNLEPVTGFDGRAAREVIERYRKEFEKPAPPPTYILPVGSISK